MSSEVNFPILNTVNNEMRESIKANLRKLEIAFFADIEIARCYHIAWRTDCELLKGIQIRQHKRSDGVFHKKAANNVINYDEKDFQQTVQRA